LSLAKEGQASRKVCSVCGRFYPGYASFCAFDRSSLQVMKTQRELNQTSSGEFDGAQSVETQIVPVLPPATSTAQIAADDRLLGADSEAPYSDLIGRTIDKKYLIQSVLGEGGMAVVYRAHHVQMERTVVIKVMQGWLLSNRNSVERFERECKLTAKLNHPNIVSVYDVGLINGKEPYLVMEYIKGESLADKIHNSGALPYATTANIIIQICRGLQEAHTSGIIHRDLKPDNVLLQHKSDRPDWVKIVDFGISNFVHGSKKLTKTGRMVGTPEYIAPEQLKDRPIDMRTDLYGIGIMMFEMLTGRVPFDGESAESILMKHLLEDAPTMAEVRPELAENNLFQPIVDKLLKKNPDDRYQTATELRLDVEHALNAVLLKKGASS
jgi:serine/threonine-protein kinase